MLQKVEPAQLYKLEDLWFKAASSSDFLFLDASLHLYKDENRIDYFSVQDGEPVGFFCAWIDRETNQIRDVSMANVCGHKKFSIDFISFIKELSSKYRVIRWACIAGTKNEIAYEKIGRFFGVRKVGTFKKKVRLADGRLYDETWFEFSK